ncbi:MAG TPA: hydroxymethylglutaryl-CoA lyase [Kineosporiaceae bacterium]|nr:hydroxymethylglutaryl-CoA lyase [Kineosporiaceae bacterium]
MTGAVEIVEVGPRDGLQNEKTLLPTEAKAELVRRAVDAGLRRIEVTSFVHPRLVPQMADAEAVMAAVNTDGFLPEGVDRSDVTWIGLVLNERGLDRALAAGVDEINVVVCASETFSQRNQNISVAAMLDAADEIAARAAEAGVGRSLVIATSFGCPFEGEVAQAAVLAIADRALRAGYGEIAVADTIGVGVPRQVHELVAGIRGLAGGDAVRLRAHFHNTRNTGYANALAAVEDGVAALDASLGGIGGCPFAPNATGNIATEDLDYLLSRSGWRTGLQLDGLAATGTWIAGQLSITPPALLGRAGPFPPAA